jgi:hypothetical protein
MISKSYLLTSKENKVWGHKIELSNNKKKELVEIH